MKNKMFALVIVGIFGSAFLAACDKTDTSAPKKDDKATTAAPAKPADSAAAPAKPADKPADSAAAPAKPAEGGDSVGVPECDDFITKYKKCISTKMPEAGRQAALDGLKQTTDAWKQAASTPEGKSALANACKQMADTQKQATQAMGCEW
jgi:hypothetical protein